MATELLSPLVWDDLRSPNAATRENPVFSGRHGLNDSAWVLDAKEAGERGQEKKLDQPH